MLPSKKISILLVMVLIILLVFYPTKSTSTAQNEPAYLSLAVIGDYGTKGAAQSQVALLIRDWDVDAIVTVGDNSYGDTSIDDHVGQEFSSYIGNYQGQYGGGAMVNRFFPSLGNHDYSDGGGLQAYLDYFTLPGEGVETTGTSGNERYYDFVLGPVHFFVLNSDDDEPDGIESDSVQAQWLKDNLEQSTASWQFVVLHHAPYSSGEKHGESRTMQWDFEDWGVDALFSGHEHLYERILRDDNEDGAVLPYFVNGLGGAEIYLFSEAATIEGSRSRYNDNYGAMLVEVSDSMINFEFWSIAGGGTLIDRYTVRDQSDCITAYNDLGWEDDQISSNITTITSPAGGSGLPNLGFLRDYRTGTNLPIQLRISGGEYDIEAKNGDDELEGDALAVFSNTINAIGSIEHGESDEVVILEFTNLNPDRLYNLVFYGDRDGSAEYNWERASQVTIFGAESFINNSTPREDDNFEPVFSGLDDASTRYAANNPDGHVVRFDDVVPGEDSHFALVVSWDGIDNESSDGYRGKYANALMLQECIPIGTVQ